MNKEYVIINGNAIISDEEGNQRIVPYDDNLGEELEKQNRVETLEKKLDNLIKEKKDFEENRNKNYDKIIKLTITIGIICATSLISTVLSFNSISSYLSAYIENLNMTNLLIMESLATSMSVIFTGIAYKNKQEDLKYMYELERKIDDFRLIYDAEITKLKQSRKTQFTGIEPNKVPSYTADDLKKEYTADDERKLVKKRKPISKK